MLGVHHHPVPVPHYARPLSPSLLMQRSYYLQDALDVYFRRTLQLAVRHLGHRLWRTRATQNLVLQSGIQPGKLLHAAVSAMPQSDTHKSPSMNPTVSRGTSMLPLLRKLASAAIDTESLLFPFQATGALVQLVHVALQVVQCSDGALPELADHA